MKVSLALEIRKSILKELTFAKFGFLDIADFTIDNRFLKSLLIPLLSISLDVS